MDAEIEKGIAALEEVLRIPIALPKQELLADSILLLSYQLRLHSVVL